MNNPSVAIIVPFVTYNPYVEECIQHCLRLHYPSFKLVLLPDDDFGIPQSYHSNDHIQIIITGNKNISQKRNIGINACKPDFYAFIDSDAFPQPEWLCHTLRNFSEETWAVGGPNICPPKENIYEKAVGNALKSILVSGTRNFRKKKSKSRFCSDLPTCNLVMKREVFDALGGFNEQLFTGEDIELCTRMVKRGKKIYFEEKAVVYHHNRPLFIPYLLQRITYGVSVFRLFRESPHFMNLYLFIPLLFLFFVIIGAVISFFSFTFALVYGSILGLYGIAISIETIRYAEHLRELPLTFLALLLGNFIPSIGSFLSMLRVSVDVKKIYRNYNISK